MRRETTTTGALALAGGTALGAAVALGSYAVSPLVVVGAAVGLAYLVVACVRPVAAVCGALLLAPAEGLQVPLAGIGSLSPTEVAFLLVAVGWVWRALRGDPRTRYVQIADFPLVALVLAVLPGAALGVDLPVVVRLTLMYGAFLLAFLTVKGFTPRELRAVVISLGLGAGLLGGLGLLAYLQGGGPVVYGTSVGGRAAFGIPDPNYFGAYLQTAAVPLLALVVARRGRWRVPAALAVAVALVAVVASLSRGALLATALALAVVVLAWTRTRVAAAAVLVAVGCLTAVNLNPLLTSQTTEVAVDRLSGVTSSSSSSDNRLRLWAGAVELVVTEPQGLGVLRFREVSVRSGVTERGKPLENAHNAYLNVAVELGVLGLVAYLAWLARVAWDVRTEWARRRPETAALAVGVGAAFAGHALQAMTIVQYRVQTILATLFVLTGVAAAARAWPSPDEDDADAELVPADRAAG